MRKEIARIAFAQIILIVYSVLGVAVMLKISQGSPAPDIFARHVRDWGFLFLFPSMAWCAWAFYEMGKPESDHRTGAGVLLSGVIMTGAIAVIGFVATISAMSHHVLTVTPKGESKPSIAHRSFPADSQ